MQTKHESKKKGNTKMGTLSSRDNRVPTACLPQVSRGTQSSGELRSNCPVLKPGPADLAAICANHYIEEVGNIR